LGFLAAARRTRSSPEKWCSDLRVIRPRSYAVSDAGRASSVPCLASGNLTGRTLLRASALMYRRCSAHSSVCSLLQRADEADDGSSVREDAHHIRAPADLLVNANGSAVPSLSASALTDWGTTSAWSQQLRDCFGLKRPDRDKQRLQLHTSSDSASVKGEWNSRSQSNTRTGPPSSKITMGRPKWGRSGVSRDPQDQRFVIGCLWRDCG